MLKTHKAWLLFSKGIAWGTDQKKKSVPSLMYLSRRNHKANNGVRDRRKHVTCVITVDRCH